MNLRRALFVLLCLAQLAVPLSLVARHEITRAEGTLWKFQTAPVDPNDPYRGRYVQLRYAVERQAVPLEPGEGYFTFDTRAYAELEQGPDGFARLARLQAQRPASGEYIDVFTRHYPQRERHEGAPVSIHVQMPFDRYYLPESRARQVEEAYFKASREAQDNTWVEVRVRDGHAAVVRLVLDGKPVEP